MTGQAGRDGLDMPSALAVLVAFRTAMTQARTATELQALAGIAGDIVNDTWNGNAGEALTAVLCVAADLAHLLAVALDCDEARVTAELGKAYAGDETAWTFPDRPDVE